MKLIIEKYNKQVKYWPDTGKHILAQYSDDSIVVYQSYRPEIGLFAAKHQFFGGAFSYSRMSWIKPNFLWMMYRNGWGTKPGQEVTLAITLKRGYFENILSKAVASSFNQSHYQDNDTWKNRILDSNVRLQWDPDHDPFGNKMERRAIQLGLRNDMLLPFQGDGIVEIEDISDYVKSQRQLVIAGRIEELYTPNETIFIPTNNEELVEVGLSNE